VHLQGVSRPTGAFTLSAPAGLQHPIPRRDDGSLGVSFRPTRDHPTDRPPPSTLPCASHNPSGPAAAGRGKGRPQADPEGTRSALPATEAAGTLIGWDARRRYRGRADVGAGFCSAAMGQGSQPRTAPSPGSLPPVPIQSPIGSTRPICLRTSPTMKVQVRSHINEEPQVLNHAGEFAMYYDI
jgi:hypothetical protein